MFKTKATWDKIPSLGLEMDHGYCERVEAREKRRHHRSDAYNLKKVIFDDTPTLPIRLNSYRHGAFSCLIEDLSESGCKVVTDRKLSEGELATVSFTINRLSVYSKAVVRWSSNKSGAYNAGLEFKEISPEQKSFLSTVSSASLFNQMSVR